MFTRVDLQLGLIVGPKFYYHTIVIQDNGQGMHILSALLHNLVS